MDEGNDAGAAFLKPAFVIDDVSRDVDGETLDEERGATVRRVTDEVLSYCVDTAVLGVDKVESDVDFEVYGKGGRRQWRGRGRVVGQGVSDN